MADLHPTAEADRAWLEEKLGAGRVQGPHKDGADHEVVLTRKCGRKVYLFGKSPGAVLAEAKAYVEDQIRRKP